MHDPRFKRYLYLTLSVFSAIAASVLLFFFLWRLEGISSVFSKLGNILRPFLYGAIVAYLLRPCCNLLEESLEKGLPKKLKASAKPLSVVLSLCFGLLVVYTIIIMIAPQLITSVVTIWTALPGKIDEFISWATKTFTNESPLVQLFSQYAEILVDESQKWVQENVTPQITSIVSGVGMSVYRVLMFLYNLLIGIIVAVYLLAGRKKFATQGKLLVRSLLPDHWAEEIVGEFRFVDSLFNSFINGKIVDSAIVGVLCYIGCAILKFPNALLISAIIGVTNVIPFFGPFIGAVPATLLILIESPVKALWFIVFVLVLQQLDGNVIGPKILGDRTGLSGFWVLFSIILFGGLWGVFGMVVAVPLFAVLYDVVKRFVCRSLRKKGHVELWEAYKAQYPEEEVPRN